LTIHDFLIYNYEVLSESSRTLIVVTASVKDEGEAKVTLPQACCISLPYETAL
jgi:hypothetical protein